MRRSQRVAFRASSHPIPIISSRTLRVRRNASASAQSQSQPEHFQLPQVQNEAVAVPINTTPVIAPRRDHPNTRQPASTRTAAATRRGRPRCATSSASISTSSSTHVDEHMYIARSILSSMRSGGKNYYLVEWEGYPTDQATWEPIENIRETIAYQQYVFGQSHALPNTQHHQHNNADDNNNVTSSTSSNIITVAQDTYPDNNTNNNNDATHTTVDVDVYTTIDETIPTPPTTPVVSPTTIVERVSTTSATPVALPTTTTSHRSNIPMFLCPNESCGVYISSTTIVSHINTCHLGASLTPAAALALGVKTCSHCSKHFRQIQKHQCPVRHLTPTKQSSHSTHIQRLHVTSMSDALETHLQLPSITDPIQPTEDHDIQQAINMSLRDQAHIIQHQKQLAELACADGANRHIIDITADGDCLYRALCVAWDIPQSQHYQLREHAAQYLQQLSIHEMKQLCIQYDNITQTLHTATSFHIGNGCLTTDTQTQHQVNTLPMDGWNDTTWSNIRDMYVQHIILKSGRYGGLLDIQLLCNSYCRNISIYIARDIARGVLSPIILQPPHDIVDDSHDTDHIALLHTNITDYTKEGNHFNIICTDTVYPIVRARVHLDRRTVTPTIVPPTTSPISSFVPTDTSSHTSAAPERVDATTNTDEVFRTHDTTNTSSTEIPVLLPMSLPPSYRHMPSMWRVIPATSKHAWIGLCSVYLQRAWRAHKQNDTETRDRALIAFLLLPRQALRRNHGQRSAKYKLKRRLQHHLKQTRAAPTTVTTDSVQDDNHNDTHNSSSASSYIERNINRATELIRSGHISRAAAAITQSSPVTITPSIIEQLKQLHPPAGPSMSACPDNAPILYLSGKDLVHHFHVFNDNGAAPGPSGWTGDLIQPLLTNNRCLDPIAMLLMLIINGEGTGQLKHMLLSMRGIPLSKPQSTKVRPIDMGEVWFKAAGRIAMKQVDVARVFPNIQYGSAIKGGCEKAIHIVQTQLEKHIHDDPTNPSTSTVAISTDIANAFNTCSRAHIFDTMNNNTITHPLLRMFHWSHSSPSNVLVYDHDNGNIAAVIPSAAGTKQGDPLASFGYNLSMQPTYSAVQSHVPQVTLVAIHDDLTIVGPLQHAMKAFDYFTELLSQRGDLQLQPSKCRVLSPSSTSSIHTAVQRECESRSLTFIQGCMPLLGGYVGTDDVIATTIVKDTVSSIYPLLDALSHAKMPSPFAMLLLRHCITSKVAYLTRVTRPEVARKSLLELDEHILKVFTSKVDIPSQDKLDSSIVSLIRLPTRLGGIGIPSTADSSAAAYLSSVCLALPHLQLLPQAPYTSSITLAHATVLTPGTGVVVSDRIPSTVDALLLTYSKPTPLVDGLQHHIQQQCYKHIHRGLLASYTTNAQRAALLSASSSRAGIPLTSIPNADHPTQVMPSALFNQYIRMRLQLPPRDTSPDVCNILQCNTPLTTPIEKTHHHQVCKHIRNREATLRHNKVLNTVLRLARDAGFAASHEEPIRDEKGQKLRPDAIITPSTPNHPTMYIDVSITHPAAQSYNTQAAAITNPLVTAKTREHTKHTKYDTVAAQDNARFVPLVLESYGSFGREFDSFLSVLGSAAADFHGLCERELKRWMACAYHDIVVALHSGNALMALRTLRVTSFMGSG